LLGSATTAPFTFTVIGATPGFAALTAVAQDSNGNSGTSSVVNVTIGTTPSQTVVGVGPNANWEGEMNVYETPQNYGAFDFSSPWNLDQLTARFSVTGGSTVLTLMPAAQGNTNNTWYDYSNPSYPVATNGAVGFKDMEANMYVELTNSVSGSLVTFSGTVITNTFYIPGASASDLCMMATNSGTATWAGNVSISGSGQWRPGSDGGTLVFLGSAAMGSRIFLVPRGAVQFASNAVVSSTSSGFLGRDSSANKRSLNLTIRDNASVTMAGCSIGGGKAGASVTITIQNNGLLSFGANTVDLHDIANAAALSTFRLNGGTFITGGFTKTLTAYTNVIDFNGGVLQAGANNTAFLPAFSPATNAVQAGGALIISGPDARAKADTFAEVPTDEYVDLLRQVVDDLLVGA